MSVIITILALVLILGVIIFVHELGHFIFAKIAKIKVNEFSMGMGPRIWGFTKGDTEYNLRLFPIGGFVAMEGEEDESEDARSYSNAPIGKRLLVIIAGAAMNLILGFCLIVGMTATGDLVPTRQVHSFEAGATTEASGLMVGDTILAVNGRNMYIANDIFYEMARVKDGKADVLVLRDGEKILLEDVVFTVEETEDGYNMLVLDFWFVGEPPNFGNVMKYSFLETVDMTRQIYIGLIDLITGNAAINQLSGPVGIAGIVGTAISINFRAVLSIVALISINLGVVNLLPLPALDGGKLIFIIIEGITKKKINPKYEGIIHLIGFILLIALMLIVTYNDITKLFSR